MSSFNRIQNLRQLEAQKRQLRKTIRRQENVVLDDINAVHTSARKWVDGVFRVKNILGFFLPKLEIATVLFPVLKRIFRKKKR